MTIRNIDRFVASIQDWAILDGCFGSTKIRPSDIDGFVERNGVCLFLEAKTPGVSLTKGQSIAFRSMTNQGNTVVVFWGKDRDIRQMQVMSPGHSGEVVPASLSDLRQVVSSWYVDANARVRPADAILDTAA